MVEEKNETFRDSLATVTKEGKRIWIYPKKPSGKFYNARIIVAVILLAFLFGAPFIQFNGHPFMLLNVLERKFILFGVAFGPHDFHLFVLAMITTIVSIFLFTVVYGRIFCGWVCPQTIFMEMVFRKIEYFIEGDAGRQKALNNSPWNTEKFLKKSIKHIVFFSLSVLIANTFLAWIIGKDELFKIINDPVSQHTGGFVAMLIFSGVFYFVFAKFREQVCTLVCPYGRLQGVMLDQNSIVIAYDHIRGEPRAKIKKDIDQSDKGDCIECGLCVDVCPTGIDIRNGTQLECVNCTACIDECDAVMDKVNRPRGLIRYDSKEGIENRIRRIFTPRSISYTIVLVLLLGLTSFLLVTRSDVELTILRTPGLMYQEQPDNKISNLYDLKIVNKTFNEFDVRLELQNMDGEITIIGSDLKIESQEVEEAKFMIILNKNQIKRMNTPLNIAVVTDDRVIDVVRTSFLGKIELKEKEKEEK
ncbi:MAG: cytochrome c oxidase accessory protein CcoG [Melioribacteraceae bacterium]|nr:cytochrome c oxidase accessory protein CcoG [Melioribacteraceae bacterium]MCF8355701.1 cytochrome c oxidase accessory protein CcoG [Melioribacteraceae bacterium]MCF8394431.1 cytochrome c oxidase accessory protein CcoG [Melioribacteraceae bacterium]MCF8418565.1 cytochrome c oxidase accessory protein CcoG [Melioribacteraceae bacterium]